MASDGSRQLVTEFKLESEVMIPLFLFMCFKQGWLTDATGLFEISLGPTLALFSDPSTRHNSVNAPPRSSLPSSPIRRILNPP